MTPLSIHIVGTGETKEIFKAEDMAFETNLKATDAVIIMDGTTSKKPTVTLVASMPDGKKVSIETTYALFNSVAKCVEGRLQYEAENKG